MIIIQIILFLVFVNFLLLIFSCDSGDKQLTSKKSRKKVEVNTPKVWTEKSNSNPVFADK